LAGGGKGHIKEPPKTKVKKEGGVGPAISREKG